jgi:hypothetical protein
MSLVKIFSNREKISATTFHLPERQNCFLARTALKLLDSSVREKAKKKSFQIQFFLMLSFSKVIFNFNFPLSRFPVLLWNFLVR